MARKSSGRTTGKNGGNARGSGRREQPRKDNSSKRINLDNERMSKFDKDADGTSDPKKMKRSSRSNDVSWYAHNAQLLQSAAQIPFSDVTGRAFEYNPNYSVPGVCVLDWAPFVGGVGLNTAINQAANQIYSYTVHANSRNTNYDASDEMLVILAGAQVFSFLSLGLRTYGLMRKYFQQDSYTPGALITASGFNFADLQANYSHMWFDLNQMIAKTRQIWIPNVMPLIERWFWMNGSVYQDGSSVKAQYYLFTPSVLFRYDETAFTTGGSLQPIIWGADQDATWDKYISTLNQMINALLGSQDRGIIFGDILKAYGADKLYAVTDVTADYSVEAVYDREVLSQIENATIWMVANNNDIGPIAQDTDNSNTLYQLFWNTQVNNAANAVIPVAKQNGAPRTLYLNFHQAENPTAEQIMVATRLMSAGDALAGSYNGKIYTMPATCGTEVLTRMRILYQSINTGSGAKQLNTLLIPTKTPLVSIGSNTSSILYNMMYYAFDWAPGLQYVNESDWTIPSGWQNGTSHFGNLLLKILDYDNYTSFDWTALHRMNTTAVLSEFGVPSAI